MRESIQVRLAKPDDADVIGYHRARMFQAMGQIPDHLYRSFERRSQDRVRELLLSGEYVGWLATGPGAAGKVVAGAGVQLRTVLPHPAGEHAFAEGHQAVIINVFTEPEWRRKGIAELLLKRIIQWSQEQQLDRLLLHASQQGRSLYERLGFVLTNEMRFEGR